MSSIIGKTDYPICTTSIPDPQLTVTVFPSAEASDNGGTLKTVASSSAHHSPTLSLANGQNSTSSSGLDTGAKIGIGIGLPLGTISLAMIGFFLWQRHRRQVQTVLAAQKAAQEPAENHFMAYLQQKGELDAEARRHEIEATEIRHEMDAIECHKLLLVGDRNSMQELKGEDHSRELEVPSER